MRVLEGVTPMPLADALGQAAALAMAHGRATVLSVGAPLAPLGYLAFRDSLRAPRVVRTIGGEYWDARPYFRLEAVGERA